MRMPEDEKLLTAIKLELYSTSDIAVRDLCVLPHRKHSINTGMEETRKQNRKRKALFD